MKPTSPSLQPTQYILSILSASAQITRYEAALINRLTKEQGAILGNGIILTNSATTTESRIQSTLAGAKTWFNSFLLATEWRFLQLLPAAFSGLGWRGRAVMPGMLPLADVFDTVTSLALSQALSADQLPSHGLNTTHLVLCTDADLFRSTVVSRSSVVWLVVDGSEFGASKRFAGFAPVYHRTDTSDFSISVWVQDQRQPCRVIVGHNRTKLLYVLNQAALWDRIASCLLSVIANMQIGTLSHEPADNVTEAAPRSQPTPGDAQPPGVRQLLAYCIVVPIRLGKILIQQLAGKRRWSIVIAKGDPLKEQFNEPVQIFAPDGRFYADPMLYGPVDGRMYCFVEEFDYSTGKAAITVLGEQDDGSWKRLGIALDEPFHLSFPYVFDYEGQLYMCPEGYLSDRITVYRCLEFPLKWQQDTIIMEDVSAADSILFESAGRWWLLTNIDRGSSPDHQAELHVFHAPTPLSKDWTPVPSNPVKVDSIGGRNGGFFRQGADLFRCGQCQSLEAYGAGLAIYQITKLDTAQYTETRIATMTVPASIAGSGTHTLTRAGETYAIDILG